MFPNPVNDKLTISIKEWNKPVEITLYNSIGQQQKRIATSGGANIEIDFSDLTQDVYFVAVKCEDEIITHKIVK